MNKILLVDKPAGWTSFDVVAKIRGKIRFNYQQKGLKPTKRQQKVGHAGTLDPFATGLLVVLLGEACTKADSFLKLDKVYETTIKLGETSDTGDPEGEITFASDKQPTEKEINRVLGSFKGEIEQTPPVYSAIKVGGRRAYDLARQGKDVSIPSRKVTVYNLDLLNYDYPFLIVRAHVSSGTYIRTLAKDIGEALGTGAYCEALRRLKIGDMDIKDAITVEEALETVDKPDSHQE